MKITKLTIKRYGKIENLSFNLDKVAVIETPFVKEICCALAELLYSDYLRLNLPKIETDNETVISGDISICNQKITVRVTFNGDIPEKKYYIDQNEVENVSERFSLSDGSFEQEMTSLFLNKYEFEKNKTLLSFADYKNYFAFYKGSKDKTLPSSEFSYFFGEKYFRFLLNNYIRNFKPININKEKAIYLNLLGSGEFESFKDYGNVYRKYDLSASEQTFFNFICFLEIGRFWGELNRIKDLHWESKPLIAVNFAEKIDVTFDYFNYVKNLKQNRQIIILKEIR